MTLNPYFDIIVKLIVVWIIKTFFQLYGALTLLFIRHAIPVFLHNLANVVPTFRFYVLITVLIQRRTALSWEQHNLVYEHLYVEHFLSVWNTLKGVLPQQIPRQNWFQTSAYYNTLHKRCDINTSKHCHCLPSVYQLRR